MNNVCIKGASLHFIWQIMASLISKVYDNLNDLLYLRPNGNGNNKVGRKVILLS